MIAPEFVNVILADGNGAAPAAGGGDAPAVGGGPSLLLMFGPLLLLFWFLILRPAQKQEKQRKQQIYTVKRGDEVAFAGGLLGTVVGIKEKTPGTPAETDEVTIRVDGANRVRALRSSIYQITPSTAEADAKDTPATT